MDLRKLHPELEAFATEGGLFDVEPCELDLHVGRFGRVANPDAPGYGPKHRERFEIVGVQKDYKGDIVYRVVFESDKYRFGCPLDPSEVILEEEKETCD